MKQHPLWSKHALHHHPLNFPWSQYILSSTDWWCVLNPYVRPSSPVFFIFNPYQWGLNGLKVKLLKKGLQCFCVWAIMAQCSCNVLHQLNSVIWMFFCECVCLYLTDWSVNDQLWSLSLTHITCMPSSITGCFCPWIHLRTHKHTAYIT